jgi:hypothetical protein
MSFGSEFSAAGLDSSEDARQRFEDDARRRGLSPLQYKVLFIKNGKEVVANFECASVQRAAYMKEQFDIDLDNDRWALKTRSSDRRWNPSIGDKQLGAKLDKLS